MPVDEAITEVRWVRVCAAGKVLAILGQIAVGLASVAVCAIAAMTLTQTS